MAMSEYYIPPALDAALRAEENFAMPQDAKIQQYFNIINALKMMGSVRLLQVHYFQLLKLGLYIEEFKEHEKLRKYDMFNVNISRLGQQDEKFEIFIPDMNLDDFIEADFIEVSKSQIANAHIYIFTIVEVWSDRIIVLADYKFCLNYNDAMRFDIKFRGHNYAFHCAHYALTKTHNAAYLRPYIFPAAYPVIREDPATDDNGPWFDDSISSNPEQRQAVMNIVRKSSFPAPYILFGPPGTGKTATLVEAIFQVHRDQQNKILITAPSNAACDELTKRLLDTVPPTDIYRIYSKSMEMTKIDKSLYKCSNINTAASLEAKNGKVDFINKETVSSRRIIIATLCTCTRLSVLKINQEYSHIFIDEAGQATEPQTLIAISLIKNLSRTKTQVVLSGDPLQLRPVVKCKIAESLLGSSFLERLMREAPYTKCTMMKKYNPSYITKLLRNYRSDKHIITMPSKLFYEGELIPCKDSNSKEFPIIFDGVDGSEKKVPDCTSSYNDMEIQKVLEYVRKFVGQHSEGSILTQEDIGVISPFALQCEKIQENLRMNNFHRVTVGTVEIFQGQEKEVIIYSTVRTKTFSKNGRKHIGALSDPRRLNVALTRPKKHLVIIGCPDTLQNDPYWLWVLEFCRENNSCQGVPLTPATLPSKYPIIDDGITLRESSKLVEGDEILEIDDGCFKKPRSKNKPVKKALIAPTNTLNTPASYQQDDAVFVQNGANLNYAAMQNYQYFRQIQYQYENHYSREYSLLSNVFNGNEEPISSYSDNAPGFCDSITEEDISILTSKPVGELISDFNAETIMNPTMNGDHSVTVPNAYPDMNYNHELQNVTVPNVLQPGTINCGGMPYQSPSTSYSQELPNVEVPNALQPSTVSHSVKLPNQSPSTSYSQELPNVEVPNALQPSTVSHSVKLPNQSPSANYNQELPNVEVPIAPKSSTGNHRVTWPNQSPSKSYSQELPHIALPNDVQPTALRRRLSLKDESSVRIAHVPEDSQSISSNWVIVDNPTDSKKKKKSRLRVFKKTVMNACRIM